MDGIKLEQYIKKVVTSVKMRQDRWNYDDGCVLLGAVKLYEAYGREELSDFVIRYLDGYVCGDGTIKHYNPEDYNLDNVAPGRALIFAYEITGNEKFRLACERLYTQLMNQPRTAAGNFWHKKIYPNQVWLDGLFMAQPFYAQYETKFGTKEHYKDIVSQFVNVRRFLYSEEKGLYCHGYDESRSIFWADPITGCSASFWLRSQGWYLMALLETALLMPEADNGYRSTLRELLEEAVKGVLTCQDQETGLFYQITDRPELAGNYLETSGSLMIAAAILGGCKSGMLSEEIYRTSGERIMDGIISYKLVKNGDNELILKDVCEVAGLGPNPGRRDGSPEYYLSEPVVCDDKKAAGALMTAAAYGK